jgi:hypothetical protein
VRRVAWCLGGGEQVKVMKWSWPWVWYRLRPLGMGKW